MVKTFVHHYWSDACPHSASTLESAANSTYAEPMNCEPNVAFLSLILMLGTLWLGVTLYEFTRTPFLNKVSCWDTPVKVGTLKLITLLDFTVVPNLILGTTRVP